MKTQAYQSARNLFRRALSAGKRTGGERGIRGHWDGKDKPSPGELARQIAAAEENAGANILKSSHRSRLVKSRLFGQDVVIKRFAPGSTAMRLKYLFRVSRGRRAWAAAVTMRELGIPTPKPCGFLELHAHGMPSASY